MTSLRLVAANALVVTTFVGIGVNSSLADPGSSSARVHAERKVTLYGSDEFTGGATTPPLERLWTVDAGRKGKAGETFTGELANISQDGVGHLVITARRVGEEITSARVTTFTRLNFDRGLLQARVRMPREEGLRPELRLVSSSHYRGGPIEGGEIEMAASTGAGPIESAIVGPWFSRPHPRPQPLWSLARQYMPADVVGDQYHIFWLRKESDEITIGVDDTVVADFTRTEIPAGGRWVFNEPMVLAMSLGVDREGAKRALRSSDSAEMVVDWVRFYG